MSRSLIYLTFVVYLIPALLVLPREYYIGSFAAIVVVLAALTPYYIKLTMELSRGCRFSCKPDRVLAPIPVHIITVICVVYLLLRANDIVIFVTNLNHGTLMQYALDNALARYDGNIEGRQDTLAGRISTILYLSLGFLWGGVKRALKNNTTYYISIGLTIAISIFELTSLSRLPFLIFLVGFLTEFILRNNATINRMRVRQFATIGLGLSVVALFIFFLVGFGRVYSADNMLNVVASKLGSYTLAPHEAFAIWFDANGSLTGSSDFGFNTFTALYKVFGVEVQLGRWEPVLTTYGSTNIYTNLRDFVMDYGMVLTAAIVFIANLYLVVKSYSGVNLLSMLICRNIIFCAAFPFYSPFLHFNTFAAFLFSFLVDIFYAQRRRTTVKKGYKLACHPTSVSG